MKLDQSAIDVATLRWGGGGRILVRLVLYKDSSAEFVFSRTQRCVYGKKSRLALVSVLDNMSVLSLIFATNKGEEKICWEKRLRLERR